MLKQALHRIADHPLRHMSQNAVLARPLMQRLRRSRETTGAMNRPQLMVDWAEKLIETARESALQIPGARVAEVGPGHSLGIAVSLLLAGAERVSPVDVVAFADPRDVESFRPIQAVCQERGLLQSPEVDLTEAVTRLSYAIVGPDGAWPLPDESVDLVYSYYAGEHLRSPGHVLQETSRVLRPGGLAMYAIDLRDHYHFDGNWLEFLYHRDWVWEAMTSRRRWCNRLRAPSWRRLFEDVLEIVSWNELREHPFPEDFDPAHLAPRFRGVDVETLSITHLWVVARK